MTQRDAALKKRRALIDKGVERKGIKIRNECILFIIVMNVFLYYKFHCRVNENSVNLEFCNSDIESMESSSSI